MKVNFVHGYRLGAAVFYVSTTDFDGKERLVTNVDWQSWDRHWPKINDEFKSFLCLHRN